VRRWCAFIAAVVFASWVLVSPGFAQQSSTEPMWGVNGHPFNSYPGVSFTEQLDAVKGLGLRSYRVNISTLDEADKMATLVSLAKERGIGILPVVTPLFDLDLESTAALYDKSFQLANALVARFKPDIRVWELGNEMENYAIITACEMQDDGIQYNCGWGPAAGTEPSHYFTPRWQKVSAVLRGLSDGASAADPAVRKAMGTAGWGHLGAFKRMRDDGVRWDISVWHHYEGDPEPAFRFLLAFDKPIWVTEFNNSGGSLDGQQRQAEGLEKMMVLLRRYAPKYRIEAAHIYELFDEPYWAPGYESVMGLIELQKKKDDGWSPGKPKAAHAVVLKETSGEGGGLAAGNGAQVAAVEGASEIDYSGKCNPDTSDKAETKVANQVVYSYCLALGRLPAPQEQWQSTLEIKQGQSAFSVFESLLRSREFSAVNLDTGLNDGDVVSRLYRLLLRREADGQGLNGYVSQLASKTLSRLDLALALSQSGEFRERHPLLFSVQQVQ